MGEESTRPATGGPEGGLPALSVLAADAGASELAAEADSLAARLAEGRFYVACVGQFKRGKSTLINALVGEPILPAGVVPVTAVVTVVRHGPERTARVRIADGEWRVVPWAELTDYVSEDRNPGNRKGVAAVEAFVPSRLLAGGMCLVDTPGLGSVFAEATAATRAFVPHIDAALVVIGADPPISGDEAALALEVGRQVDRVIVVLNKADRLSDIERHEAIRFAERVLTGRTMRPIGPVLQVSATDQLAGTGPSRDWNALERELDTLAQKSGAAMLRAAEERGLELLLERFARELGERKGALTRPLHESERRLDLLRAAVADAERSLSDLPHLLTAEEERLARDFAAERERFLARALPQARKELAAAIAELGERGPALRRGAFDAARDIAERAIAAWREEEQPRAAAHYRHASHRFVELANGFLERLRGLPGLLLVASALPCEAGFRGWSGFFQTSLMHLGEGGPGVWLLDVVGPRERRRAAAERAATTHLAELLDVNSARMQNDFIDRVRESRRGLEADIRGRLRGVSTAAERALHDARAARARGGKAVAAELARLDALARAADKLRRHHRTGEGP
jgi:GTP-binding protein EngB required for normal cell division